MCLFEIWDASSFSFDKPPDSPPSTISAENVFGIPELLANILSHLPAEDLLTKKQLVNTTWKAAVENTPKIKTKLWAKLNNPEVASPVDRAQLAPGARGWPGSNHTEVCTLRSGVPVYTGSGSTAFAINTLAGPSRNMCRDLIRRQKQAAAEKANAAKNKAANPYGRPLFARFRSSLQTHPRVPLNAHNRTLVKPHALQTSLEPTPFGAPLATIGLSFLRSLCRGFVLEDIITRRPAPQPVWLRMFLTDPPVNTVWLEVPLWFRDTEGKFELVRAACSLRIPSGVTFGDVKDAVGKLALGNAMPHDEVSIMTYDVRVCFLAEGMIVDGKEVGPVTKLI